MGWLNVVLLLYGLFDILMGFLGYYNKGSVPSLIAGGVCGMVVIFSVILHKYNPRAARITALVVALLMMGNFVKGTLENKLYPQGLMFFTSLAVAICLLAGHVGAMAAKRKSASAEKK